MRKKRLIVANTYYQLMLSIHIKCTIFIEDDVYLMITSETPSFVNLVEKLRNTNIFYHVEFFDTSVWHHKPGPMQRIKNAFVSATKGYFYSNELLSNTVFDEIVFYNGDNTAVFLLTTLFNKNENIVINRMEEGILSYNVPTQNLVIRFYQFTKIIIYLIRLILRKKQPFGGITSFYCLYPEAYNGNLKTIRLPQLSINEKSSSIYCSLFNLKEYFQIKEKYIFFTSVYDFEGGKSIGEFEAVEKVANIVGKDNLLVKVHPRDNRDIYRKHGYKVFEQSSIPWEVYVLSGKVNDSVCITTNSSSVLSNYLLGDLNLKTVFVYNLCDLRMNILARNTIKNLNSLLINYKSVNQKFSNICIPKNEKELRDNLI